MAQSTERAVDVPAGMERQHLVEPDAVARIGAGFDGVDDGDRLAVGCPDDDVRRRADPFEHGVGRPAPLGHGVGDRHHWATVSAIVVTVASRRG